jgi:phosphatidylinositol dimannoside acyltransferase
VLWFDGDGWGVRIGEEICAPPDGDKKQKVAAMTQQVARFFEAGIRDYPQDWHMLQRVFTADLDPARLAAAQARATAAGPTAGDP